MRKSEKAHLTADYAQEDGDGSKEMQVENAGSALPHGKSCISGDRSGAKKDIVTNKHAPDMDMISSGLHLPEDCSSSMHRKEERTDDEATKQIVPVDREPGDNQLLVLDNNDNNKDIECQSAQGGRGDRSRLSAAKNLVFLKDTSRKIDGNIYPERMKSKDLNIKKVGDETKDKRHVSGSFMMNECAHEAYSMNPVYYDRPAETCVGFKHKAVTGGEKLGIHYTESYYMPRKHPDGYYARGYVFPDGGDPLLYESLPRPPIYPINGYMKTLNDFRRMDMAERRYQEESLGSTSHEDLLDELKNVARHEAKNLANLYNKTEEIYFQPPVSPSKKHSFQHLKDSSNASVDPPVEPKIKARKVERVMPDEGDSSAEHSSFKSFNDFDEEIFKFDLDCKMYICPWNGCDKTFPSLSRIKRHYIIHTDIKPFKCLNPGCDRRFSRKDNMLQHYRVHCPFASQYTKT